MTDPRCGISAPRSEATGKSDQALLYYIKSYMHGPPDPARRSVIETVYKKVNGTLDGPDDKIGPGFSAATATPHRRRDNSSLTNNITLDFNLRQFPYPVCGVLSKEPERSTKEGITATKPHH
jgi:hypothetical protein